MDKIDIIIPVYKPDKKLFMLIERLCRQTIAINRIILMNTEEKYFEELIYGTGFWDKYKNRLSVYHLSHREFDHGGTRRKAAVKSDADIFVMMTQDAIPADASLLEHLVEALAADNTAVAYARQLPDENCGPIERFTRQFNYPGEPRVKTKADLRELGIKTYFCSNVCAAYNRKIYEELGGFVNHTIFNEDMIFAARAVNSGYAVSYAAKARVIHSHNYTNRQQLKRNFDLGVSQAEHPEVFEGIPSESEGGKMVSAVTKYLRKSHKLWLLPHFYVQCACRYLGYQLGKHYKLLPRRLIMACTSNKAYWGIL